MDHRAQGQGDVVAGGREGRVGAEEGALFAFVNPFGLWVALLGTVWFIVGSALTGKERGLPTAGSAAAEYIETVLQLFVNTISFVRVGAFALAHAGLSAAVIGMADGTDSLIARAAVLTLGNILIIGLEGLVVSIQTTRLVLFEFFIRFLRSSGRQFRPLPSPEEAEPGKQRRES